MKKIGARRDFSEAKCVTDCMNNNSCKRFVAAALLVLAVVTVVATPKDQTPFKVMLEAALVVLPLVIDERGNGPRRRPP